VSPELLWFNLEILLLSGVFVAFYAFRSRIGFSALYVVAGVLLTFMAVAGRLRVSVPIHGSADLEYSPLYLSLLMSAMVLIYTLEGTKQARAFVGAMCFGSLMLVALKWFLAYHLHLMELVDPGAIQEVSRERWTSFRIRGGLISTFALFVDFVVIIIVYQAIINLPRIPLWVGLSVAQLAGMIADGLVFDGFYGSFDPAKISAGLTVKAIAGLAASIPTATYITFVLRDAHDDVVDGVLHRGVLEIVTLKRELESVSAALEKSKVEYAHIRDVFGRYVVPDVVDEILKHTSEINLEGELKDVSIIFTDIRGYSTLSEQMPPTDIISLLNQYFGEMSEIINTYRGTIIEFEGDGILAVFGAPLSQDDHADRAFQCSVKMLERVPELNRRWDEDGTSRYWRDVGLPSFRVRIGLHSGSVVVGNVGSQQRTKYAVIGDTVNTTARIESLNKVLRTLFLFSSATRSLIHEGDYAIKDMGVHDVKGRAEPVSVFTVAGLGELPRQDAE
jgi:class 3 adenylate cyclase